MKTTVVNIHKDYYDEYIGRAGRGQDGYYGNPYILQPGASRGSTLNQYRQYFHARLASDPVFKQRVHQLKGKILGCFCKPRPCHGDVIAEYLNTVSD